MKTINKQQNGLVVSAVITRADGTVENLGVISDFRETRWQYFFRELKLIFKKLKYKYF